MIGVSSLSLNLVDRFDKAAGGAFNNVVLLVRRRFPIFCDACKRADSVTEYPETSQLLYALRVIEYIPSLMCRLNAAAAL